jgi:hypothetical protein
MNDRDDEKMMMMMVRQIRRRDSEA